MSRQIYNDKIPQGWEVKKIGEILKIHHGRSQKEVEVPYGKFPILATSGQIGWTNSFLWDKPSVLIGRKGTIDKPFYKDTPFWTVDTLFYSEIFPENSAKLIYYKFCMIDWMKNNEATGVPSQNAKTIENLEILIPKDRAEQERIAQVLGDFDELISAKIELIDKKRAIKEATAQQLLTPKPHWYTTTLGEILQYEQPTKYIIQGIAISEKGSVPVLTAGKSFILGYTEEEFNCYENFPVIIFDDFTTDSKFVNFRFKVKSSAMKMLKPRKDKISIKFAFILLQSINFIAGDHKRHWISEFSKFKISLPIEKVEQDKIAEILSDMDDEISALQDEVEKLKMIKQSVMSELLSGKIRLKG